MSTKIYVTRDIPQNGMKMLLDKGYEVDVGHSKEPPSKKDLIKVLRKKNYDGILSLLTDHIDSEIFEASPTTRIVSNYAVGFNNIDIEEAQKRNIVVTNAPGCQHITVAEHTVAMILALATRLIDADQFVRDGKYKGWDPMIFWGMDLEDKVLGIIGCGRIGGRVAHVLSKGFGMKVIYNDIKRNEEVESDCGAEFRGTIEEILKEADFVSLHCLLDKSTHHLLGASHLNMMKKTAYLINTSRGPVVDEEALVDALKTGVIAGAGLDVYEFEPKLSKGLTNFPNVVLTPHIASATKKAREEMATLAVNNLIDFFEGREPKNKVTS